MLTNIYNQRITILNKLKRTDSATGLDVWYKSVVDDAAWYKETLRDVNNSSVFIGEVVKVLIPFNEIYIPYKTWKLPGKQENYFTMSTGDYIILGDVPEEVTAKNVTEIVKQYAPDVCTVKSCRENHKRFWATVQLKIEGV